MNENQKDRIGIWVLGCIPAAMMGGVGLGIWTGIQLHLYSKEKNAYKSRDEKIKQENIQREEKEKEKLQRKIEYAEKVGLNYEIIGGEVIFW